MLPVRHKFVEYLTQAFADGARKAIACHELGLTLRTLQRWTRKTVMNADAHTTNLRPVPPNALSRGERVAILDLCNSPEHANLPPSQIVPRLADQGR